MKVTPVLWTIKKNDKGLSPVYLRLSDSSKTRYVSLSVFSRESQWNSKLGRARRSHKHADAINAIIAKKVATTESEILRLLHEGTAPSVDHLKRILGSERQDRGGDFLSFAYSVMEMHARRGQIHTFRRYKSIIGKLSKFVEGELPFEKMTLKFLRSYETHLIEHHNNAPNTVAANINVIRTVYFRALSEELVSQNQNPFFNFRTTKVKTTRHKLSSSEIEAIEALDLVPESLLWHTRNSNDARA